MPRKRTRRLAWGPVLWVALAANTAMGLWLSPATAVRRVRVTGASSEATREIEWCLRGIESVPAARIAVRELESKLQRIEAVDVAEFSRNLFGSAKLAVIERHAVASVEGRPDVFLDRSGSFFTGRPQAGDLPVVVLPADAAAASLTMCGCWPAEVVAFLCDAIGKFEAFRDGKVEIEASGSVSLWAKSGARVELGGPENMERKLAELSRQLSHRPRLMEEIVSLNIVSPSRPMIVPKTEGVHR